MPFPFTLPTTSSFSHSSCFESNSHPSLPLSASTYRGVLRDTLKKQKHLAPQLQSANLSSVLLSLESYLPYLFALDQGLSNQTVAEEEIDVVLKTTPSLEWRATLSSPPVPGREPPRQKFNSLEYEVYFVLSTLAYTYNLLSRAALQPLYSSATSSPSQEQRTTAITTATRYLMCAASIHSYLSNRSETLGLAPPCVDITTPTFRALSSLALAEATIFAVLKDDPYPAVVAQDRNKNDKEWMIKAPDIPKVRAHLFARLCLAASEHAAQASSLLGAAGARGRGRIDDDLLRYAEDLRRTGRGKACRFFGIDAELGGKTGEGIAWLRAGLQELGVGPKSDEGKKGLGGLGKLKKEWSEKREDRKVEQGAAWGADAGRSEEARVLEMLEKKWMKMNDTINTQPIPPTSTLLTTLPSGRNIHTIKPYLPPSLDASALQSMRAPPSPPLSRHHNDDDDDDDDDDNDSDHVHDYSPSSSSSAALGPSAGFRGRGRGDYHSAASRGSTETGTRNDGAYY